MTTLDEIENEENQLKLRLKKLCNVQGKELNRLKTASIFNQLGLLYLKKSTHLNQELTESPDKICLLQSAALLNAAISRQPCSQKYKNDLFNFCKQVLVYANAKNKDTNLIEIAKKLKVKVEEMREKVNQDMILLSKLIVDENKQESNEKMYSEKVQRMQNSLSNNYKDIIKFVSDECINIMTAPPCKFVLVGMGSLARHEITPYSDFEHVLVLENFQSQANEESAKKYFRWYTFLFHVIVLNLQETILPSMCIPCMNNDTALNGDWFFDELTSRGVSFDGLMDHACKFPLGRTHPTKRKPWKTELIQPVDEMVKHVNTDEEIKNGYYLGLLLRHTCYVCGDEQLYELFRDKMKQTSCKNDKKESTALLISQTNKDLKSFHFWHYLDLFLFSKSVDIKRGIYRGVTLFISAIGQMYNLISSSSFDIIKELKKVNLITNRVADKLLTAVAVACHTRLHHCMAKKTKLDVISYQKQRFDKRNLNYLVSIVGRNRLFDCFEVILVLQDMLILGMPIQSFDQSFFNNGLRRKIVLHFTFGDNLDVISLGEKYQKVSSNSGSYQNLEVIWRVAFSYYAENKPEKGLKLLKTIDFDDKQKLVKHLESYFKIIFSKVKCLIATNQLENANLEIDKALSLPLLNNAHLRECLLYYGALVNFELGKYQRALVFLRDCLKLKREFRYDELGVSDANCLFLISKCLMMLSRPVQAYSWGLESLNLYQNLETSFYILKQVISNIKRCEKSLRTCNSI